MNMLIQSLYKNDVGEWAPLGEPCSYPDCGWHGSPEAAVKELKRRFAHAEPIDWRNGIELWEHRTVGTRQRVWFE